MIDLSLLEDFVTGAGESLDEMETALLDLEKNLNNTELLDTIFRAMHTIKGAAQFVGLDKVSALSHALEDLLDLLRNRQKQVTLEIINLLIEAKDRISLLVVDLEKTQTELTDVDDLIADIHHHLQADEAVSVAAESADLESLEPEELTLASATDTIAEHEDISSFLSEEGVGNEDLSNFLTENQAEDVSSFLSEDPQEAFLSAFLAENLSPEHNSEAPQEELLNSFLAENVAAESHSEPQQEEFLSSFLAENLDTEQSDESNLMAFLAEDTQSATELLPEEPPEQAQENDFFVLPDEEYDQELLAIFISQLQEKFALLKSTTQQLASAHNKSPLLNALKEILESLKFSANYMAYQQLTQLYARWIEEIVVAEKKLTSDSFGEQNFAFIDDYLRKLQTIFPILENATDPTTAEIASEQPLLFVAALDDASSDEIDTTDSAFIAELMQGHSIVEEPIAPVIEEQPESEKVEELSLDNADASLDAEEDDLFKKLTSALDSKIEEAITSEPINELFGALLATAKEEQSRAQAEKEHQAKVEVKTLAQANQEPEPASVKESKTIAAEPISATEEVKSKAHLMAEKSDKTVKPLRAEATTEKAFKKSIRVDADKIDSLMNQVGELIVDRAYFFQLASEINELQHYLKNLTGLGQKDLKPVRTFAYRFSEAVVSLGRTSNELQEGVMKVRMLPIAQIFNRYPRLVHDVAHTNGKKVQLEIRGEETELDKMIIEEISDPLIHMIRNAIGHGIETPEVRKKAGKLETGTLILEAYHESNHIVIEVTDDGRGIDTDRIKVKAEEMGLFSKEELNRMSKEDLTRFIMMPGFSTAKEISSTSGRGVGMDVVKKNIEKLNGTIEVESQFGIETKVRLKIPLTLAIIQALLVKVGGDSFTIPLANVEETLRVSEAEISIMEDTEVMYLRGKTLPIFRLATLFNLKSNQKVNETDFFVVVVNTGNQRVGLMVDALLGREEVVIKPLADYLHDQNCFSGATIIGDGRISLILDVYELINMTTNSQIKKHHDQEKKSLAALHESE